LENSLSRAVIDSALESLKKIRSRRPLVHNITNYVVMNFTANALLALGASPVMAHAIEEVEEMAALASALVINLGTLSSPWVRAMYKAAESAGKNSIPIVLDPVGAGATRFRTDTARKMIEEAPIAVVRGNASEILAAGGLKSATKGVDSIDGAEAARDAARELARKHPGMVVAVTGVEDFVTGGGREVLIANGHVLMGRITGTGCAASSITGAFCGVEQDFFLASAGALVTFGIAGELAAASNPGPGTFQTLLLDGLDTVSPAIIEQKARVVSP